MANQTKLIVILHADIIGSTTLVQRDERISHERIQDAFRRFSDLISAAGGITHEIRGDALVAEFGRASDAVSSALAFQSQNSARIQTLEDDIRPELRVGIALGEVIVADGTLTGVGVVLAQRIEQLAQPNEICISAAIREALPGRLAVHVEDLGERELKGFDHPQRVYRVQGNAEKREEKKAAGSWPVDYEDSTKPSIAVLPFDNLSGDPEQLYFTDGLTEELITALSKSDDLFVIARNSSFTFRGGNVDVQKVGAELGARYVLEGSVRSAVNRLRITAQLIDAASRQHVWAERFDGTLENIFDLQDAITTQIVGQLLPHLERAEIVRVSRGADHNASAYDLYLRALHHFHAFSADDIRQALEYLGRALQMNTEYASALALSGVCRARMIINSWDPPNEQLNMRLGAEHASRAAVIAPDDSTVLWMSGFALGRLSGDQRRGLDLLDRAKILNPNSYAAFGFAGLLRTLLGEAGEAIEDLEHSIRLNPIDPRGFMFNTSLAFAYNQSARFEDAKRQAIQALRQNPRYEQAHREYVVSCHRCGDSDEASIAANKLMEAFPNFSLADLQGRFDRLHVPLSAGVADHFDALREAGLPEG